MYHNRGWGNRVEFRVVSRIESFSGGVIPNIGVLQSMEGSCVDHVKTVPPHARSLV